MNKTPKNKQELRKLIEESSVISCLKLIAVKKEKTFAAKKLSILHKELMSLKKIRYEKNAFIYIDYIDWINKKLSSLN